MPLRAAARHDFVLSIALAAMPLYLRKSSTFPSAAPITLAAMPQRTAARQASPGGRQNFLEAEPLFLGGVVGEASLSAMQWGIAPLSYPSKVQRGKAPFRASPQCHGAQPPCPHCCHAMKKPGGLMERGHHCARRYPNRCNPVNIGYFFFISSLTAASIC